MLPVTRYARILHPKASFIRKPQQTRSLAASSVGTTQEAISLPATSSIAEQLIATNLWARSGKPRTVNRQLKVDKSRVNIVGDALCDDILSYIGPSLQRHVGCDLIDINPGTGLWSRKLHDFLQPRTHLLLEPDAALYRPFLQPLLERPNTILTESSGILWKEMNDTLQLLKHQKELSKKEREAPQRNDTLLVTANISFHPRKKYGSFDSVARLVLYQLIASVRASSLFQKYGLVRMLVWTTDEGKKAVLPRAVNARRKGAVEAELACEWINEVVGKDNKGATTLDALQAYSDPSRDYSLDLESTRRTLHRMRAQGLTVPPGREGQLLKDVLAMEQVHADLPPNQGPHLTQAYEQRLAALGDAWHNGLITNEADYTALQQKLERRKNAKAKQVGASFALAQEHLELLRLRAAGDSTEDDLAKQEKAWNEKVQSLGHNQRMWFRVIHDNTHVFHQNPPAMLWDRRSIEPLTVKPTEFFPNVDCCLLDIQPKVTNPLLREMGRDSSGLGNEFDMILKVLLNNSTVPLTKQLDVVWPGAAEPIIKKCPSLRNVEEGGLPGTGHGELSPRLLNEVQLMEILEAWGRWPFRPTHAQLIGRHASHLEAQEAADNNKTNQDSM